MSSSSSSEKPIEKRAIYAGKGPAPEFKHGTKIKFHFVAKQLASTPDGEKKLLDDSRAWPGQPPMELVLGKKFKLEVWELCLQTMTVGEVAEFKVKKQYTFNYPTVAKTLRDTYSHDPKDKHKKKKESGHMCGMMAMQMQGGVGYDDLNELMKQPAELEFTMELLSVEQPDEYEKESWQMDADEKLLTVPQLREQGNDLYKQKKLKEAADKYSQALGMLEQLMLREKPQDEEWLELRSSKIPLLLNFSQCKLSLQDYYPAIEHCTEVLEAEPDNVKALFRRGKAHAGAWNPAKAKEDLGRAALLDQGLKAVCDKEIKHIEEMQRQKDAEDKRRLSKLF